MPELPEVERARQAIEVAALGREIADVDDTDAFVCRPHLPGDIKAALVGRCLSGAHRRGKTMWCDVSGPDAPTLGLHLGMAGRIVVSAATAEDPTVEGGDPRPILVRSGVAHPEKWSRFTLRFADAGELILLDPRRLGRVRLNPHIELLGPDALTVTPTQLRALLATGTAPVKARLLDQSAIAGVGNLLADEVLWQARIDPRRRVRDLGEDDVRRLQTALRKAVRRAIERGGVHTGDVITSRHPGGHCPRCGTEMQRGVVGGRTTWWCPADQR